MFEKTTDIFFLIRLTLNERQGHLNWHHSIHFNHVCCHKKSETMKEMMSECMGLLQRWGLFVVVVVVFLNEIASV